MQKHNLSRIDRAKNLYKKGDVMFRFFVLAFLLFAFQAKAQPLKTTDEIVFSLHNVESCLKDQCNDVKVSGSLLSGKVGDLQLLLAYKFTGDKGKFGGQAWYRLNPHFWLGVESLTSLKGDFDHEIFVVADFTYKKLVFLPFAGIYIQSESLGGAGLKIYYDNKVSIALEYRTNDPELSDSTVILSFSASLGKSAFGKVQEFLGFDAGDLEKQAEDLFEKSEKPKK